jgi:hypothetical protein
MCNEKREDAHLHKYRFRDLLMQEMSDEDRKEQEAIASPKAIWHSVCNRETKLSLPDEFPNATLDVMPTVFDRPLPPLSSLLLADGSSVAVQLLPFHTREEIMADSILTVIAKAAQTQQGKDPKLPSYCLVPEWYLEEFAKNPPQGPDAEMAHMQFLFVPSKYLYESEVVHELITFK